MNPFRDNADLQHHFQHGIRWDRFVPLWEDGFGTADGPRSLAEARELYDASLQEAGEYMGREVAPRARAIDEQGVSFENGQVVQPAGLHANIDGFRKLGMMAMSLPRDVGGYNFPFTVNAAFMECLSRACTNTLLLHAFYQGPAVMILRFGTPDQVERWVKPLAAGEISGAVAMTEPDAGSDVGNVQSSAVEQDGRWRLSGRKQFITNGCGDVCVVLARTEPGSRGLDGMSLFVVPRREGERDNYRVARPEKKFVIRGSATCELSFDGSCAELLGRRGGGFAGILTFMNEARLTVGIQGLGLCEAALTAAQEYAGRRVQMGRPIARHELVADMLFDMEAETAALRALIYRTTELQDRLLGLERTGVGAGAPAAETAQVRRALRDRTPLVKWFGSERTLWVTRTAVQVLGGYGVVHEYDVERHYRNALILPIYEGTSQIQALMSLKDQSKWALSRPWRLLTGAVQVEAEATPLGDALRDLAGEYNRTLRSALTQSLGVGGLLGVLSGREARREDMAYALLCADRLILMLSHVRAAEALCAQAAASPRHRRLADRFVHRALPLLRMHGDIVRSGDRTTLEATGS